jgi:hypothetical protein
MEGIFAL